MGFFFKLDELEKHGDFMSVWIEDKKFLWFVNYSKQSDGYDYDKVTQSIIEKLPQEARKIIGR